jgi:pyridoxine/pyridoxamine 5'-phosphate oxidase
MNLKDIRKNYSRETLSEKSLHDPFPLFEKWLGEAIEGKVGRDFTFLPITTAAKGGRSGQTAMLPCCSSGLSWSGR